MTAQLELKGGVFTLTTLLLKRDDIQTLPSKLADKVLQAPDFFNHVPIVIDLTLIGDCDLNFEAIYHAIKDQQLVPVGVRAGTKAQRQAAKAAGFALMSDKTAPQKNSPPTPVATKFIEGSVRSGQQIYAQGGDLIIMGQVGHGAEVLADGNIHIYGTLRGRAMAGVKGDTNAKIICQDLQSELISINGQYWLSDALQGEYWRQAVIISANQQQLTIKHLKLN